MKKYFVLLFAALVGGSAAGWAANHYRYDYRTPMFGPITFDGAVTAENAMEAVDQPAAKAGIAQVELLSHSQHDFGVMSPGDEGEHAFKLKNTGDEPLTLRVGATSCKCTLGNLAKDTLQPGEETEVTLSWSIKTESSQFSQSAQLHTNDPSNPVIDLVVTGRVVRDVEMIPEAISFGEVASGEAIEFSAKVYNYIDGGIEPTKTRFSSEEMTKLSTFEVEEYEPSKGEDGVHSDALQAFNVKVRIAPGLQQGSVSQNLIFEFRQKNSTKSAGAGTVDDEVEDFNGFLLAATTGRIVGVLSMIPNPKLTGREGGGYIYDFGRVENSDSLTAKAFVVLKGSQMENTKLSIGDVKPDEVIKATLGDPLGKGTMNLYPLELTLVPGDEPVERLGQHREDYGLLWIESDNPAVPRMRIGVKFAIPSKNRLEN